MEYNQVLDTAMATGKRKHPNALIQHHAAFANSVAYLVTGASGGYGGPSVREHAVSHAMALSQGAAQSSVKMQDGSGLNAFIPQDESFKPAGSWSIKDACQFADEYCYGELSEIHFQCFRSEHCFDDSPEDIEALKKYSAKGGGS